MHQLEGHWDRVGLEPIMDYDSKERGYRIIETNGVLGLYLSCLACKHTVVMFLGRRREDLGCWHVDA